MSRTALYAAEDGLRRDPRSPEPAEVRAQLRTILSSPAFLGSKRCCSFLEYVCEKSMTGEEGALKERVIAAEVYGRQLDSAGHGDDTIVRVGAREVRKRLAQYYVTGEGAAAVILIDLPPGSYVPEFRRATPAPDAGVPETATPAPGTDVSTIPHFLPAQIAPVATPETVHTGWSRTRRISVAAICLAGVGLAVFGLVDRFSIPSSTAAFQRFWKPVFQSPTPLLIGVGHPIVYQPSNRVSRLSAMREPPKPFPMQEKLNLAPEELNGSDMIPVMNQYVGFGDLIAATGVSQMLAERSRNVRILLASSIPFADLRQSPVYLIGSLTNHWTMELSQNWRYQFAWTSDHVPVIRDTWSGTLRQWSILSHDDGTTSEDYAMICRVRSSPTGAILMIAAGIKQFGTEAAGRVLSAPTELSAILAKVPSEWEDRNLQIVLHMKVIGNTPAQPVVVASHVW
jgi:hypothetical protein